jgi:hypothetical protein
MNDQNWSKAVSVSEFRADRPSLDIPREKISAVSAAGFLICWEFDDVVGLLAITDEHFKRANPADHFEGFWVTHDMFGDVFNPTDGKPGIARN